jgi:site-specific DNA-cytosine methylase
MTLFSNSVGHQPGDIQPGGNQAVADRVIIDLCSGTGGWSRPYREAGYTVLSFDLLTGQDVRLIEHLGKVHGILAGPPCTDLAASGARWWAEKGEEALLQALSVADDGA